MTGTAGGHDARAPVVKISAAIAFIGVVSAVFLAFPGIDLWFSGLFYEPGHGFFGTGSRTLGLFRKSNDLLAVVVIAGAAIMLGYRLIYRSTAGPSAQRLVFLLATFALGPGLVVNLILKDNWGRPRPYSVDAFGGASPYVPVWQISDYCSTNCSFVAGEPSSAIWLAGLAVIVPWEWRVPTVAAAVVYALAIGLNRIAFGGHFLSDVLLSYGLTVLVMVLAYWLIVARSEKEIGA